jgi:glycosyltransferase involved in cell wall biosynthesis
MGGKGSLLLKRALDSIRDQSYKDLEVVISDHSVNEEIEKLCKEYAAGVNILYIKNIENRGNFSSNLNNSIRNASGEIIKLLMQDDYLMDNMTLEFTVKAFDNPAISWLACGCYSGWSEQDYNSMIPRYDGDAISKCVNTIGSPSVISIRNRDVQYFDENLSWVVDLDYYKKMNSSFGEPHILNRHSIFVQRHPNQITNTLPDQIKMIEESELRRRYA